jgi:hypothetical protein
MGQVLHGSATTTEAVRRAIQHSQASLRALAKRYGINQKTVAKWKGRTSVADLPTRPKKPRSTDLTKEEGRGGGRRFPKAYPAAARRLPVRSATHHSAFDALVPSPVSAAPRRQLIASAGRRQRAAEEFKTYPIGFFHVDIAELQTAQGKLNLFVAIDRPSKFAVAQLVHKANMQTARRLLGSPCRRRA